MNKTKENNTLTATSTSPESIHNCILINKNFIAKALLDIQYQLMIISSDQSKPIERNENYSLAQAKILATLAKIMSLIDIPTIKIYSYCDMAINKAATFFILDFYDCLEIQKPRFTDFRNIMNEMMLSFVDILKSNGHYKPVEELAKER